MKHQYVVSGMTCNGCVASVKEKLLKIKNVLSVAVNLENSEVEIEMNSLVKTAELQQVLQPKYSINDKEVEKDSLDQYAMNTKSKLKQLKPLFLILGYLLASVALLHYKSWDTKEAMLDFMGLFYIVFSFFKFLDLKGFSQSFSMYDPLAKLVPYYGWMYPFLETLLGVLLLMRLQIPIALVFTLVVLGITTIGVTKSLLDKKSIRCACLGTALNLPMTEATFIENAIMLVMAILMLMKLAT